MGLFNRKKKGADITEILPIAHEHTWKDMPWYMKTWYDSGQRIAGYSIIEPYICISCGERKDKVLEKTEWTNINSREREEEYENIHKKYKAYLRPQAVVEDMINDILLVKDANHLDMIERLRGLPHRGVGTSSKYRESNFRIRVDDK